MATGCTVLVGDEDEKQESILTLSRLNKFFSDSPGGRIFCHFMFQENYL